MKRVVLTGATGFVGANLARRLLREGHEVHLLVRHGHDPWRIREIAGEVTLHLVELDDAIGLTKTLDRIRPDWIFHLAAHGAYSWQTDDVRIVRTNVFGTGNLIGAALKVGFETFVNTGSSSEYGFKDHAPAEDEETVPNSPYAIAKAHATTFCHQRAEELKVRIPTLRLYSIYGAYEDPRRLVPALINNGLKGKWPPLVNPNIARDYVFIDDACDAYLLAATSKHPECGAIYNVGTGVQTSLAQAVEVARKVMNIEAQPQWGTMTKRVWDTDIWVANNEKIKRELGWEPKHDFEAGLRAALPWFEANQRD